MGFYDLDGAMGDSERDHMTQGDIDSYYFFKGFVEQSVSLDDEHGLEHLDIDYSM